MLANFLFHEVLISRQKKLAAGINITMLMEQLVSSNEIKAII